MLTSSSRQRGGGVDQQEALPRRWRWVLPLANLRALIIGRPSEESEELLKDTTKRHIQEKETPHFMFMAEFLCKFQKLSQHKQCE